MCVLGKLTGEELACVSFLMCHTAAVGLDDYQCGPVTPDDVRATLAYQYNKDGNNLRFPIL